MVVIVQGHIHYVYISYWGCIWDITICIRNWLRGCWDAALSFSKLSVVSSSCLICYLSPAGGLVVAYFYSFKMISLFGLAFWKMGHSGALFQKLRYGATMRKQWKNLCSFWIQASFINSASHYLDLQACFFNLAICTSPKAIGIVPTGHQ